MDSPSSPPLRVLSKTHGEAPRVRGSWCALLRDGLEHYPQGDVDQIEARIGTELDDAIALAGRLGWVPAEIFVDFADAVRDVLGDEAFAEYYRQVTLAGVDGLLTTMVQAGVRLFGRRAMVRTFVPGWEFVARGCATIRVGQSRDEVHTIVEFSSIPAVLAQSRAFRILCHSSLRASIDTAGFIGEVDDVPCTEGFRFALVLHIRGLEIAD